MLRGLRYTGTLLDNPFLASVALTDGVLDQRLRALPGITFRRMGNLTEFEWDHATLTDWAESISSSPCIYYESHHSPWPGVSKGE